MGEKLRLTWKIRLRQRKRVAFLKVSVGFP